VAVVELFLKKALPLLDWGNGMVRSSAKEDSIDLPVAALVNHRTAAAAEALAAVLRQSGAGLVFGARTAGRAMISQDYPLKNGQRLRIATTPIQLGDGTALSGKGVTPDINVEVTAPDEQAYYGDAYTLLSSPGPIGDGLSATNVNSNTNRISRRGRINEAELVRERRDASLGLDQTGIADGAEAKPSAPEKPVVQDPVLARAIDVLKGLAVVRHSHS
jgi:hypothetical protein